MKRTTSFLLAICLALSLITVPANAASSSLTSAQQVVQALGIIVGDGSGDLNLSGNVTRAQFAKMMIAASNFKDSISSTAKSSPFKDVKYTHWAASYVQKAVSSGWITGYTDGTFRPDNIVKLEEAVSGILKMLGYTSTDFSGSFPEAQIAKYNALGLNENISKTQGQTLSRQDCMYLFYNLMKTKNKSGSYYSTTLGYTVNSSGEIDYSSLVLANMKGPFIVQDSSWTSLLPFTSSAATVYKNGSTSSISSISTNDVFYYNTSMRTVWVYRNQVSGLYTAASPSTAAPSSVTVAGKTYTVSTTAASYDLSDIGSYHLGSTVTLLLGKSGDVVAVISANDLSSTKYGIITAKGTKSYTDASGNNLTSDTVNVVCTDGSSYEYFYENSSFSIGNIVKISFTNGIMSISAPGSSPISGSVNSTATAIGSYSFADDVQILDTTVNGSYAKIYPSRIKGQTLSSSDIRFCEVNSSGQISQLILNDVTGEMYQYGILTSISESYSSNNDSSYKFIISGNSGSFSSASTAFGAKEGPALFEFSGSNIIKLRNLDSVTLTSLSSLVAQNGDEKYSLGDNVSVYICANGNYSLSSISSLINSSGYTLKGYYDKAMSEGGRIRVIVAYAN